MKSFVRKVLKRGASAKEKKEGLKSEAATDGHPEKETETPPAGDKKEEDKGDDKAEGQEAKKDEDKDGDKAEDASQKDRLSAADTDTTVAVDAPVGAVPSATPVLPATSATPATPASPTSPTGHHHRGPVRFCRVCGCRYLEGANNTFACNFHSGDVFFRDAVASAYVPTMVDWDRRYAAPAFRWTCCEEVVGRSSGCQHRMHVRAVPPADPRRASGYHGRGGGGGGGGRGGYGYGRRPPSSHMPFRGESAAAFDF